MNKIRHTVEALFASPIQDMTFVSYMSYINSSGKITAKSILDLCIVALVHLEEQEKKNEQYEANFKEIESIFSKLLAEKDKKEIVSTESLNTQEFEGISLSKYDDTVEATFRCDVCSKEVKTKLALAGHMRSHKGKE